MAIKDFATTLAGNLKTKVAPRPRLADIPPVNYRGTQTPRTLDRVARYQTPRK